MNIELTDKECLFLVRILADEHEMLSKITKFNDTAKHGSPVTHIFESYLDMERDLFYKFQKAHGEMLSERIEKTFEEELKSEKDDEPTEYYPHRKRKRA